MARHERIVGFIRCRSDVDTVDAIASATGLRATETDESDLFCISDSGRDIDSEVGPELLAAVTRKLDQAVRKGTIASWRHEAGE